MGSGSPHGLARMEALVVLFFKVFCSGPDLTNTCASIWVYSTEVSPKGLALKRVLFYQKKNQIRAQKKNKIKIWKFENLKKKEKEKRVDMGWQYRLMGPFKQLSPIVFLLE